MQYRRGDEISAYFILNYYQSHQLEGRREETHSLSQEMLAEKLSLVMLS